MTALQSDAKNNQKFEYQTIGTIPLNRSKILERLQILMKIYMEEQLKVGRHVKKSKSKNDFPYK